MKRVDTGFSIKVAAPLALAVLAAHLFFLQATLLTDQSAQVQPLPSFSTRMIEITPAPPLVVRSDPLSKPPRSKARPRPTQVPLEMPLGRAYSPETAEPLAGSAASTPVGPSPNALAPALEQVQASTAETVFTPHQLRQPASPVLSYAVPDSLTLQYQVQSNKFPYKLNAEFVWQHNGEHYEARLAFGALGFNRVQTSRGQITPEGLAPQRFSDKYRSELAAHFVRDKGKISFSANTPEVDLLAGAQDRLSIMVQLAAMLGANARGFASARTIAVQTVSARAADTWHFTIEDDEILELPGGVLSTRKLVRNARRDYDQKVELWLAPSLGYLPARIRITEFNGDYIDQKWFATEPLL